MKVLISGGPAFLEIAKGLQADEYISLFPQVGKMLADVDLPVRDLSTFFQREDWPEIWTWLHAASKNINGTVPSAEAAGFVISRITHFIPNVIALDRAKPDVLILHNDVEPATRLAALWERARNVPCVHVPHAIYVDSPWRGPTGSDVHDLVTATHLAAAGPYQANWYAARDPSLKISITGAPRWDWIARWNVSKKRARQLLHIPENALVVTYATSWAQKTSKEGSSVDPFQAFLEFLEAIKEMPLLLIVKLHPSQADGRRYVDAVSQSGVQAIVTAAHLPYVLTASDLVIVFGPSNLVIEAIALERPVVCHKAPFPCKGVKWVEKFDPEVLIPLIQRAPIVSRESILEFTGPLDGNATSRVVDLVRSL